jgi:hypothetical protein
VHPMRSKVHGDDLGMADRYSRRLPANMT